MILQHRKKRTYRRAGFSLMELLVVVAILVVLAGVGGVIYLNIQEGAQKDAARVQIQALEEACKIYKLKVGDFPESLEELTVQLPTGDLALMEPAKLIDPWGRPYLYNKQGQNMQYNKPDIWSQGPRPGDVTGQIANY